MADCFPLLFGVLFRPAVLGDIQAIAGRSTGYQVDFLIDLEQACFYAACSKIKDYYEHDLVLSKMYVPARIYFIFYLFHRFGIKMRPVDHRGCPVFYQMRLLCTKSKWSVGKRV